MKRLIFIVLSLFVLFNCSKNIVAKGENEENGEQEIKIDFDSQQERGPSHVLIDDNYYDKTGNIPTRGQVQQHFSDDESVLDKLEEISDMLTSSASYTGTWISTGLSCPTLMGALPAESRVPVLSVASRDNT